MTQNKKKPKDTHKHTQNIFHHLISWQCHVVISTIFLLQPRSSLLSIQYKIQPSQRHWQCHITLYYFCYIRCDANIIFLSSTFITTLLIFSFFFSFVICLACRWFRLFCCCCCVDHILNGNWLTVTKFSFYYYTLVIGFFMARHLANFFSIFFSLTGRKFQFYWLLFGIKI